METGRTLMMPYHVRTIGRVPWQQYYFNQMDAADKSLCFLGMRAQHMSDSTSTVAPAVLGFEFRDFPKTPITETMLLDEVKGVNYLFQSSNLGRHFVIDETTVEIEKQSDGSRAITGMREDEPYKSRSFLAHFVISPAAEHMIKWFLNPTDGSFFQIHSKNEMKKSGVISCHIVSWFQLDDRVKFSEVFDGCVKPMAHHKLEFPQFNMLDPFECGILFSDGGRKMLIRFRIPNPEFLNSQNIPEMLNKAANSKGFSFDHELTKPPTYALFGLDYQSHKMQILVQFVPTEENHCDLLISTKLLSIYGLVNGFPNPVARSFLSQESRMIGQFLKYTFFSSISNTIGIIAVKSLTKTLQTGRRLSLTPKKVWFPIGDEKFKLEFKKLSEKPPKNPFPPEMTKEEIRKSVEMKEKPIKWEMLSQKKNITLVFGDEFILQIYDPDEKNPLNHLATIRVKLGPEYKDYRKCAGCGKGEKHKRRNKDGKRTCRFKVCIWCKAHHLHKLWWERPCHYCSKKCAIDHFPKHKWQHKQQQIEGKVEGKK